MKNYCLIILFFFTFVGSGFAQRRDINALSDEKRFVIAHNLVKQGGYYAAIDQFKVLLEAHPDNESYMFELAEAYFDSRDYANAEKWYHKIVYHKDSKKRKKTPQLAIATFRYGESLKYNGKYEQAREVFEHYVNGSFPSPKGKSYNTWAKNEVLSCEFALGNKDRMKQVQVENMNSNVNSAYSDFAPVLKNDSTLVFSSIRKDSVISVNYGDHHFEHTKIYISDKVDSVWQAPRQKASVNSVFEHSGNGTYSPDGKRFYFTRCRVVDGEIKCQIYVSKVNKNGVSNPRKLGGHVNHPLHTSTHPYSVKIKEGKQAQEVLFFASDMKGTIGGMDIWYSVIGPDGKSGKPVNCGHGVNTSRDEITPYYDAEDGVLYFSSNFHFGFGGFDIFRATGSQNKYGKPENLFEPINSNLDDTYYKLWDDDKFKGFLVSNRPGGRALLSPTCCDDIYSFQYFQPTIMVLNVIDSATGEELKDVDVKLSVKATRYTEMPDSLLFNTSEEVMDNMETKSDSSLVENLHLAHKPQAFYVLDATNIIQVSADKQGYESAKSLIRTDKQGIVDSVHVVQGSFSKIGKHRFVTLKVVMGQKRTKQAVAIVEEVKQDTTHVASSLPEAFAKAKKEAEKQHEETIKEVETVAPKATNAEVKESTKPKPEPIPVPPVPKRKIQVAEFPLSIHFQYNKVEIVESDQSILDSLVEILKSDPKIKMEFTTHTDGIGSEEYNMKLSYRRAAFINNYIVLKGIGQKRVKGRGLGETLPVAPNTNPDGSDNPQGRQLNRRTNIKLISGT